ncbi:MAG: hypothetical protein J6L05_03265 [Ruminococcus sp.]|nr:hypothetical protein [Ruminococcus sp.]
MSMDLVVVSKGTKYVVQDKKSRVLYNVKKKGFGQRYVLLDTSNYHLYTLLQTAEGRKPAFSIILNDDEFLKLSCKSLFLDPTIIAEGKNMNYSIASKDRKNFDILFNGVTVGHIATKQAMAGVFQYDLNIENTAFDDYIPLFAVAIDIAFGDINKQ